MASGENHTPKKRIRSRPLRFEFQILHGCHSLVMKKLARHRRSPSAEFQRMSRRGGQKLSGANYRTRDIHERIIGLWQKKDTTVDHGSVTETSRFTMFSVCSSVTCVEKIGQKMQSDRCQPQNRASRTLYAWSQMFAHSMLDSCGRKNRLHSIPTV